MPLSAQGRTPPDGSREALDVPFPSARNSDPHHGRADQPTARVLAPPPAARYTAESPAFAPVAQWIEQRFPNSFEGVADCLPVDVHRSIVASVGDRSSEEAIPATGSAKPAIPGGETIADESISTDVPAALLRSLKMALDVCVAKDSSDGIIAVTTEIKAWREEQAGVPDEERAKRDRSR